MGIIAVSDVHLGYMNADMTQNFSDKDNFMSFLDSLAKRDDITDFVICGDLLDMWRRDMVGVTIENLDILDRFRNLQSKMKIHYLAGNHDYHVRHLTRFPYPFGFSESIDPRKGITIMDGGKTYRFKHGYDLEKIMSNSECYFDFLCSTSDEAGEFKSWLYDTISNVDAVRGIGIETILKMFGGMVNEAARKAIESLFMPKPCNTSGGQLSGMPKKDVLSSLLDNTTEERMRMQGNGFDFDSINKNIGNNEILVFGHTHKPFHYNTAINLGSWIINYPVHSTYLEIKDGQEKLKIFPNGEVPKETISPSSLKEILNL